MDYSFEQKKLELLKSEGLLRSLKASQGLDFCSNDYLGFASDNDLLKKILQFQYGLLEKKLGSSGSRLIRGHNDLFVNLEQKLSETSGYPASLFFSSGYQCNLGVLSALLQKDDLVFSDQLNHASLIDGIKLSGAQKIIYPHLDLDFLEGQFKKTSGRRWLVTESIFSMDGDSPDLASLADLCRSYDINLIVDEAHATGLFGHKGGGLVQELNLNDKVYATTHMCGKAWGQAGGWVSTVPVVKDFLLNHSRAFIYSTAPMSFQCVSMLKSIEYWQLVSDTRIENLKKSMALLSDQSLSNKLFTPIFILPIKNIESAVAAQDFMFKKGFDVRAIRYPTVDKDKPRLRITIPGSRTDSEIKKFIEALTELRESFHVKK